MKQRIAAFLMCVICLLSVVGCGQTKADTNTPSAANQQTVTDDYLTTISGTYVELFPELSKADYRSIWHDATAPLVGEDNADAATDKLLGMCTAKIYGADAAEKYAADPDSMAFDCYFPGRGFEVRDGRPQDHRSGHAGQESFLPHLSKAGQGK